MTYRFKHWPVYFTRLTIDTDDVGLTVQIKSLRSEATYRYEYSELKPFVVRGRTTDDSYSIVGWALLAVALATLLLGDLSTEDLPTASAPGLVFLVSLAGAVAAFATRLIKYDCAWFMTKLETTAFGLAIPPSQRKDADALIEEVERRAAGQNEESGERTL